jgi:hypothetical protein
LSGDYFRQKNRRMIIGCKGVHPVSKWSCERGVECLPYGRKHLCKKLHQCVYIGVERVKIIFNHLSGGTEENRENLGAHCPSASIWIVNPSPFPHSFPNTVPW